MDGYRLILYCPPVANLLLQYDDFLTTIIHSRKKSSIEFIQSLSRLVSDFWIKKHDITHSLLPAPKKCATQFVAILKQIHAATSSSDSYIQDCFGDENQWIHKIIATDRTCDVQNHIQHIFLQQTDSLPIVITIHLQSKCHVEYPMKLKIHDVTYNLIQVVTKKKHYCFHGNGWNVSNTDAPLQCTSWTSNVNVDYVITPAAEVLMYLKDK
jgi:hypothetical protein